MFERKIIELNCWFGRRCAFKVFCSMRPAKLPAAFCCRSVIVVDELTNVLVTMPFATTGTAAGPIPEGQPLPSGLQPLDRLDCNAVNDERIGAELTWLASVWL